MELCFHFKFHLTFKAANIFVYTADLEKSWTILGLHFLVEILYL